MKVDEDFFVIAHNMRSLFNVGSVFRTADAFGVTKLFLTGYTGTPPNSKLEKVSLGAENTVPWEHNKSAARVITSLRKQYPTIKIIGLENNLPSFLSKDSNRAASPPLMGGVRGGCIKLQNFKPNFPLALILGEEVSGIPKPLLKLCDQFVEIPMNGKKESLNVSVAFGIAAYALTSQALR